MAKQKEAAKVRAALIQTQLVDARGKVAAVVLDRELRGAPSSSERTIRRVKESMKEGIWPRAGNRSRLCSADGSSTGGSFTGGCVHFPVTGSTNRNG